MDAESSPRPARRLTEYSHGGGCACKLDPALLDEVLGRLGPTTHPDLLVGAETGDDAAVWRLGEGRALVLTTDFFTPIVDDPTDWGRIAAVNAVSDVYAMGGRPLIALNLVAWNSSELDWSILASVIDGASSVADEEGFLIVGGHSIDDPAPKYGMAVVGEADPDRLLTNSGLRPGDVLVLTKPVGVGVVTTAIKSGAPSGSLVEMAVRVMTRSNRAAAEVALDFGATGATDVTGFGLLGHLARMAGSSGVDVRLDVGSVPIIEGVRPLVEAGLVPGGTARNLRWVGERLDRGGCDEVTLSLLGDPQTSGGLLFGLDPDVAANAVHALRGRGVEAAVIGSAEAGSGLVRLQ